MKLIIGANVSADLKTKRALIPSANGRPTKTAIMFASAPFADTRILNPQKRSTSIIILKRGAKTVNTTGTLAQDVTFPLKRASILGTRVKLPLLLPKQQRE